MTLYENYQSQFRPPPTFRDVPTPLHIGISDHSLIYVCKKISFAKKDIKTVNTRNYRNYIQHNFISDLSYHLALLNWENNDQIYYGTILKKRLTMFLMFTLLLGAKELEVNKRRGLLIQ